MNDKHDPNGAVPIGTFAATEEGEFEIPIEVVNDDDVDARNLAIQAGSDDGGRFSDEQTPVEAPRRKRVQTLLGVALPGAALNGLASLPAAHDPTRATKGEISRAVDEALDEQQTTVYGQKRESGGLRALDTMLEARSPHVDRVDRVDAPSDPGEIVGVVGQPTDTGTYQIELFDIDIDEASRTGDVRRVAPAAAAPAFVEPRVRERVIPPAAVEPQPTAAAIPAAAPEPRVEVRPAARVETKQAAKPEPVQAAASKRAPKSEPAPKKPVSSLAPAEIARPAAARRKESSPFAGVALLAAMVLLGIGGWWLTAGGYQRTTDAASQPSAAARPPKPAPDSLAAPKTEEVAPTAPAPEAPAEAPAEANAPAPAPEPSVGPGKAAGKPRVAAKTVRKPVPAPVAETGPIETPSRSDVLAGLDRVRSTVQACAEGRNGVAEVDLTIAANGFVTNALVGGDFGGTPQGSCIARAVRKARFPQFKQDRYRVLFPYVL